MKTSELIGPALDWAVAKIVNPREKYKSGRYWKEYHPWKYSTDWSHGGPIIEREEINISMSATAPWMAWIYDGLEMTWLIDGPTPLIAAMRCLVASKLGDEVEIPEELQ